MVGTRDARVLESQFFASFFFINVNRSNGESRITGRHNRSVANRTANLILTTLPFVTTLFAEEFPSPLTSLSPHWVNKFPA